MEDAKQIIEAVARSIGVSDGAIRQWRSRGKVPHHIRFDLSEAAKEQTGRKLKHADFENFNA